MTSSSRYYDLSSVRKKEMSRHAAKRASQRGISAVCLPLVVAFGEKEFDGRGGVRYLMTAESIASLRRAVGSTQQVDALVGVYAVLSAEDQTVITIGHRHS
ncbi:hypothetical protein AB4Y44_33390 [Paraburkholderia sp. BR10937]|uniref:hypothetical protein n=1 Tax=Paraburkholderia sp. BR10937 TaxID=3236994 RepID=UPI0034D1E040